MIKLFVGFLVEIVIDYIGMMNCMLIYILLLMLLCLVLMLNALKMVFKEINKNE